MTSYPEAVNAQGQVDPTKLPGVVVHEPTVMGPIAYSKTGAKPTPNAKRSQNVSFQYTNDLNLQRLKEACASRATEEVKQGENKQDSTAELINTVGKIRNGLDAFAKLEDKKEVVYISTEA